MSFEKSLSILDDMQEEVNQEVRATALNVLRLVVFATPVDSGAARGNWFVAPSSTANRSQDESRRAGEAISQGSISVDKAKVIKYPTITLSNNLPYIERLNTGYSDQAPAKFVELAIQRVERS